MKTVVTLAIITGVLAIALCVIGQPLLGAYLTVVLIVGLILYRIWPAELPAERIIPQEDFVPPADEDPGVDWTG